MNLKVGRTYGATVLGESGGSSRSAGIAADQVRGPLSPKAGYSLKPAQTRRITHSTNSFPIIARVRSFVPGVYDFLNHQLCFDGVTLLEGFVSRLSENRITKADQKLMGDLALGKLPRVLRAVDVIHLPALVEAFLTSDKYEAGLIVANSISHNIDEDYQNGVVDQLRDRLRDIIREEPGSDRRKCLSYLGNIFTKIASWTSHEKIAGAAIDGLMEVCFHNPSSSGQLGILISGFPQLFRKSHLASMIEMSCNNSEMSRKVAWLIERRPDLLYQFDDEFTRFVVDTDIRDALIRLAKRGKGCGISVAIVFQQAKMFAAIGRKLPEFFGASIADFVEVSVRYPFDGTLYYLARYSTNDDVREFAFRAMLQVFAAVMREHGANSRELEARKWQFSHLFRSRPEFKVALREIALSLRGRVEDEEIPVLISQLGGDEGVTLVA